jgi:hypothetical protein
VYLAGIFASETEVGQESFGLEIKVFPCWKVAPWLLETADSQRRERLPDVAAGISDVAGAIAGRRSGRIARALRGARAARFDKRERPRRASVVLQAAAARVRPLRSERLRFESFGGYIRQRWRFRTDLAA